MPVKLFGGQSFSDFSASQRSEISNIIFNLSESDLLNLNAEEYVSDLVERFSVQFPEINEAGLTISSFEAEVPANRHPQDFFFRNKNSTARRNVIVFHVPYIGDKYYLTFQSTNLLGLTFTLDVSNQEILFEYVNFYDKQEDIKQEFDRDFRNFKSSFTRLQQDFETYNTQLAEFVTGLITTRRQELFKKNEFLQSFNIPLKRSKDTPTSFSIPRPKTRKQVTIAKETRSRIEQPEPTLNYSHYQDILKIIDDVGKNFERMPSIYKGRGEEDLRDFILFVLDPNFTFGSATGETFNKGGKTDISLRYDSSVVFIAECKFWAGQKSFHEALDQLLGYLTWRDSKTALITFVQNKEITSVIETIQDSIKGHGCYLSFTKQYAENWFEYQFHLPGDPKKGLYLSVLIFHLPVS